MRRINNGIEKREAVHSTMKLQFEQQISVYTFKLMEGLLIMIFLPYLTACHRVTRSAPPD